MERRRKYLKEYVEKFYEIAETSEKIFISTDFPDEYANSESRMVLKGAVAKAKANAAQGIPELIQIASNQVFAENTKKKHIKDAKYGWYRYDVRFALPVYDDKTGKLVRYNIFSARMLVRTHFLQQSVKELRIYVKRKIKMNSQGEATGFSFFCTSFMVE